MVFFPVSMYLYGKEKLCVFNNLQNCPNLRQVRRNNNSALILWNILFGKTGYIYWGCLLFLFSFLDFGLSGADGKNPKNKIIGF